MSQYGISPYGGDYGPYGGPGLITLLGVLPAAVNRLIAVFDAAPLSFDPKGLRSATNTANYTLEPIDPTISINGYDIVPDGAIVPTKRIALARARVDPDDPRQIHIWTDRDMEPQIEHRLAVVGPIHGLACEMFAGPGEGTFFAPAPAPLAPAPDRLDGLMRDLDDGGTPSSGELPGVWRYQQSGEIALQSELESLKKRIIRRCTQAPRAYVWSPNGVDVFVGSLMTPDAMTRLATQVSEMARKDMMVRSASCTVTPQISGGDAYVYIVLAVQLRDRRDVTLTYLLPVK